MNSDPISFTGRLTLQDALDLNRYRMLCLVRPSFRWFIGLFSFSIAALIIVVIVMGKATTALWVILVLCIYFPIGWWYERQWAVRFQYRRHPEQFIENTATIGESSVSISNVNMDLRLNWKQVAFLLDTPRGLMFMLPQVRVLWWLPQRLFEGNNSKETIIVYASKNKIAVRAMK